MVIHSLSRKVNPFRFISMLVVMVTCVAILSCSKDNDPSPEDDAELQQEIGSLPGLGEQSGTPQGTAFKLPDGVTVDGTITGDYCDEAEIRIGSGHYVTVCVGLRNDNDEEKKVIFPGGLILVSETDEYQHGVVVEETMVVIPPKKTIRFIFHTYCGNNSRSSASSLAVYTFGPVTNSKLLGRLIDDLKGKKIAAVDYWDEDGVSDDYYAIESTVQALVWQITDGSAFMDWETFNHMYQQQLNELPNK
ncbi:hypothetical protein GCM10007415_12140 [Parapedobacter pyrenivorans]|uniref:Uncharacterized protein n=2 Tax=Parapedobacter pyrenivorans TaxID=1305674 RepID=A0A917HK09_9SPHI|nr:hypothetical protein GCM10007415_12140 [Parapedobacter pyrenivorans]